MGKKIMVFMMAFVMVLTAVPMIPTQAANTYEFPSKIELKMYPNRLKSDKIQPRTQYIWGGPSNAKITQLKNSNKKVASVKKSKSSACAIEIVPKSAGSTKISFKYAGKKYASVINVGDYESPIKSIKIGKQDFTKKFEISNEYTYKQKKNLTGKFKIKLKKDWKIKKMCVGYNDDYYFTKIAKNNKNISLRTDVYDGMSSLIITLENKKTNEQIMLGLNYSKYAKKSGNVYIP